MFRRQGTRSGVRGKSGTGQIIMALLSHNTEFRLPPEGNEEPLNTKSF